MKTKILLLFALLSGINAYAQDYQWGIGLRVGDPTGISVKKYLSNTNAVELNIGKTAFFINDAYFRDRFNLCNNVTYTDCKFDGFRGVSAIAIQGHYLFNYDFSGIDIGKLQWYFGFGPQLRFYSYLYDYKYKLNGSNDWIQVRSEKATEIDIGVDGVFGIEYAFEGFPVSVFLDIDLFIEIFNNPFFFYGQGGLGARYSF